MFTRRRRRAVSPVIATLLLAAITIGAALMLYVFVSGLFTGLTAGGPAILVTATGQMSVPGTYGNSGVLTLTLRNGNARPITGISVSCSTTYFSVSSCSNGTPPSTPLIMQYRGAAVSPGNVLPLQQTASANAIVLPAGAGTFTSGTTYTVLLSLSFAGGSTETIAAEVTSVS